MFPYQPMRIWDPKRRKKEDEGTQQRTESKKILIQILSVNENS